MSRICKQWIRRRLDPEHLRLRRRRPPELGGIAAVDEPRRQSPRTIDLFKQSNAAAVEIGRRDDFIARFQLREDCC
jgi:hypothetical protein